jgi:hypothetical protein
MSNPLNRRTEIFVIRLWAEYLGQNPPAWRGEIEHVKEKQVICFQNEEEMVEKMQGLINQTNQVHVKIISEDKEE